MKAVDVIAQFLGRDGGVFDEGERLRIFLHRHRKTERGFAQIPDAGLLRKFERVEIAVAEVVAG